MHYFTVPATVQDLECTAFRNCPKLDVVSFQGAPPTIVNIDSVTEDASTEENAYSVFSGSDYDQLIGTYPLAYRSEWESEITSELMWDGLKMVLDSYYDNAEGNFYYQVYGGEATITGVIEPVVGDVILPTTLGDYLVTGIDAEAFGECTAMTSVTIPATIVRLGDYAFVTCTALKTVTFEGGPLTKGELVEMPFPEDQGIIGYYPASAKNDWTATGVIQAGKWYGLTMKSKGTVLRQVSTIVAGPGSVTGSGTVVAGTAVTLTATADESAIFLGWSGDVISSENPLTLTSTKDLTLTANFLAESLVTEVVEKENEANGVLSESVVQQKIQDYIVENKLKTEEEVEEAIVIHVTSNGLLTPAEADQKTQDYIADNNLMSKDKAKQALLDADEVFTADEMKDMAFGSPVVEVKDDVIEIAISLQTAETLDAWQAMALQGATLEVDETKGQVRVKVPKGNKNAAFYKFVVLEKQ